MKFTRINILSFLFLSFVFLPTAEAGGNRNIQRTSRSISAYKMAKQKVKIARHQGRYQKQPNDPVFSFSPKMNLNHPYSLCILSLMLTAHIVDSEAKSVPTRSFTQRLGSLAPQHPTNCTIISISPTAPWPEYVTHTPHAGIYVSGSELFESVQCVKDAVHHAISESMHSILPLELSLSIVRKEKRNSDLVWSAKPYLIPQEQEITRTGAIDSFPDHSHPIDGKKWQDALHYIDINLIEQPLEDMSFEVFESHLFRLNGIVRNSKELSAYQKESMIIWKKLSILPRFHQVEAMRAYLKEKDPKNLKIYNTLVNALENKFPSSRGLDIDEASKEWIYFVEDILLDPSSAPEAYDFCRAYYQLEDSDPKTLRKRLRSDFAKFKSLLKQDKVIDGAAFIHQALVKHHIFEDGNGRTARAILEATLKQKRISPITFWSDEHYQTAVNKALEEGSLGPFINYIRAEVCRSQSLASSSSAPLDDALLTCHAPHCQDDFDKELIKIGILHPIHSEDED
jgi:prophage maintenance system killer protein